MDNDSAALLVIIELRQKVAALEAENAALREQLYRRDREEAQNS